MNTDNQPTPDDGYRKAWQQAFDQAAETPSPRVWNAVERQLDADNRTRIIPLWANVRPWVTGLAASVNPYPGRLVDVAHYVASFAGCAGW